MSIHDYLNYNSENTDLIDNLRKKILLKRCYFNMKRLIFSLFLSSHLINCNIKVGEMNSDFVRNYKKVSEVIVSEFDFLATIYSVKVSNDFIFFDNFTERQIKKIDFSGNIIKTYGKKGSGPGEFLRIDGWSINDSNLFFWDSAALRITSISKNIQTYNLSEDFMRAEQLNENEFIFFDINWQDKKGNFSKYSLIDRKKNLLAVELPPQIKHPLSFDGFFTRNKLQEVIFVSYKMGYFIKFSKDGEVIFSQPTVDKSPPVKIMEENGKTFADPKALSSIIYSCDADEKYLFICSKLKSIGDFKDNRNSIDIYDLANGEYRFSLHLGKLEDEPIRNFVWVEEKNEAVIYQGQKIKIVKFNESIYE